jgi:long-chain acyl-CoA synthetase
MQLTKLTQRLAAHTHCSIVEHLGSESRCRTFPELKCDVEAAVRRLQDAGINSGMRIGILAKNCHQWIVYELAIIEMRCVTVALVDEVVTKGLEAAAEKYGLHLIVTDRELSVRSSWIMPIHGADLIASVRLDVECMDDPEYEMPALVFSSGSSGRNKVIQTCRSGVEELVANLPAAFELQSGDNFIVFLPMSSFQQRFLIYGCLWNGVDLVITEPKFLFQALKKHPPTILLAPPAFFEAISTRFRNMPSFKKILLKTLHTCREKIPCNSLKSALTRMTSRKLQDTLGGRIRLMITGMAPIHRSTLQLFDRIGIPVYEVYGMTECGMISWNTPCSRRLGSVGKPLDDATVQISEDSEVLVTRAVQPTVGYLFEEHSEDEQSLTYRGQGMIATGDIGYFDADGFLYLQGRKKNIIITAGGVKLHPEVIEDRLNVCVYISQSVVFGKADGLAAVIVPSIETSEICDRIHDFINDINRDSDLESQIIRVIFSNPLTAENGLLTANLKLNRKAIEAKFNYVRMTETA